MGDAERIRVVTMGGARVGKSAILRRFLFNTFCEKYKPTVEELYNKEFDFGATTLKVDFLDTAGDSQFPAMRRLSISSAHAFLLVYSATDAMSFEVLKACLEEIREQRSDFTTIPIVIAGNKIDLLPVAVHEDEVDEWLTHLPRLKCRVLECSAKDERGIQDLFRSFLTLAKISLPSPTGLKRRSSAYHSRSKGGRGLGAGDGGGGGGGGGTSEQFLSADDSSRSKPRSRSLIRRSSRKAKEQVRDASTGAAAAGAAGGGDCVIT